MDKFYEMEGMRYKVGRFGMVFREDFSDWKRSTVTEKELIARTKKHKPRKTVDTKNDK